MSSHFFTVKSGNEDLFSVGANEISSVNRIGFSLTKEKSDLSFTDSKNSKQIFDLSSVLSDGYNWVDICVQITKDYIVQADCRLGSNGTTPDDPENIMFQPILLPESNLVIETKGKNIHNRGFFSWWSGSRKLSLIGICDYCRKSFRLSIRNTSGSPENYYYCKKGIHSLLAKPNREYSYEDKSTHAELESRLPLCSECGDTFKRNNSFRCVHCEMPYLDLEAYPDEVKERYALLLYGQKFQLFDYYQQS